MLGKEDLPFATMSEGEISMLLWSQNQQLRSIVEFNKGNITDSDKHSRAANHFRRVVQMGLHGNSMTALAYPFSQPETNDVNAIVEKAMKANKPALTFTSQEVTNSLRSIDSALMGNPVDEFDPSPQQLGKCRADANLKALNQLLPNGKRFDPGTFDPNTEEVKPLGTNGDLVVINKSEFAVLSNRIYAECIARVPFENIINKKLTDAGNFVIYRLMEDTGVDIRYNNKVNNRIFQQSKFISATASATGLSFDNVKMVLENSAIRINEDTPRDTLNKTYSLLFKPDVDSPVPVGLPPLGNEAASTNFVEIIVKLAINIIVGIVNAIKKRRAKAFAEIPDPSIVSARCSDANIPIQNCTSLANDNIENINPDTSTSNTGLIIGGLLVLGIGVAAVALSNNKPKPMLKTRRVIMPATDIEFSEV